MGGQRAGTTPAALSLRVGGYEIGLEHPGFKPYRGNIEVDQGGAVDLEARLERDVTGFAEVRSEPPSASVFIDGEYVGVTPLARLELPVGAHQVVFRLSGYRAETEGLEITAGRTSILAARLSDTGRGVLSVLSEPRNSTVRIDDAVVGTTPLLLPLPQGSYRVKLSRAGYGSVTRTVEVMGGRPTEVTVRLQVLPPPG